MFLKAPFHKKGFFTDDRQHHHHVRWIITVKFFSFSAVFFAAGKIYLCCSSVVYLIRSLTSTGEKEAIVPFNIQHNNVMEGERSKRTKESISFTYRRGINGFFPLSTLSGCYTLFSVHFLSFIHSLTHYLFVRTSTTRQTPCLKKIAKKESQGRSSSSSGQSSSAFFPYRLEVNICSIMAASFSLSLSGTWQGRHKYQATNRPGLLFPRFISSREKDNNRSKKRPFHTRSAACIQGKRIHV